MTKRGTGPLFVEPDCDAARRWFRDKPKEMSDKAMSVAEAVRRFVSDRGERPGTQHLDGARGIIGVEEFGTRGCDMTWQ